MFLARWVFEQVRGKDFQTWDVLDLCAGCGIIGLDLLFHMQHELGTLPQSCDFLEVQSIYTEYFAKNQRLAPHCPGDWILENYEALPRLQKKYDLIVSNPPYFFKDQGKLSPSDFKNRCRFFLDSSLDLLLQSVGSALKPTGQAYLLLPDNKANGPDPLDSVHRHILTSLHIETCGDIRGTRLLKIHRPRD